MLNELFDLATYRGHFVKVAPLALYLGVDRRTINRMIESGALEAIKVGRSYRIPVEAARAAFHVKCSLAS